MNLGWPFLSFLFKNIILTAIQTQCFTKVAGGKAGLPRSGKNIWKNENFSRSGKSQGILWMAREI